MTICQSPLRFCHCSRTSCGRGYSGSTFCGETAAAHRVLSGPSAGFHPPSTAALCSIERTTVASAQKVIFIKTAQNLTVTINATGSRPAHMEARKSPSRQGQTPNADHLHFHSRIPPEKPGWSSTSILRAVASTGWNVHLLYLLGAGASSTHFDGTSKTGNHLSPCR